MNENKDKELERLKQKKMKEMMAERKEPDFPSTPVKLTDENFQDMTTKYSPVVVDFWADWCAPCKAMEPIIERLADEYSGKAVFGKLNVDRNQRTARRFQVSGIPTLLVLEDGNVVDRIVGMTSKQKLEARLTKYLE